VIAGEDPPILLDELHRGAPDDSVLVAVDAAVADVAADVVAAVAGTASTVAAARAAADGPAPVIATVIATVDVVVAAAGKTCRHAKGVVLDSFQEEGEDAAAVAVVATRSLD
jgi:DNA topoisomerase IB